MSVEGYLPIDYIHIHNCINMHLDVEISKPLAASTFTTGFTYNTYHTELDSVAKPVVNEVLERPQS